MSTYNEWLVVVMIGSGLLPITLYNPHMTTCRRTTESHQADNYKWSIHDYLQTVWEDIKSKTSISLSFKINSNSFGKK